MKDEFLRDLLGYIPSKVLPALFAVAAIPLFTRLVSPAEYGRYALALGGVTALELLLTAWMMSSAIRFYSPYRLEQRLSTFYSSLALLGLIGALCPAVLLFGLSFSLAGIVSNHDLPLLRAAILLFAVDSLFMLAMQILRARQQIKGYTGFALWQSAGALAVGALVVLLFRSGALGLILGAALAMAVALPILIASSFGSGLAHPLSVSRRAVVGMLAFGLPLIPSTVFVWVLNLSDRFIIGHFQGSSAVGLYAAGYDLPFRVVQFLVSLLGLAAAPVAVKIWEEEGKEAASAFLTALVRYYMLIALPIACLLAVLARPILVALTTSHYEAGYVVIPWVAIGSVLLGLQWIAQQRLLLLKRTRVIVVGFSSAGVINAVANWILIPRYGFVAAAWTTFAAYAILLAVITLAASGSFPLQIPWRSVGRGLLGAAAVVILGLILNSLQLPNLVAVGALLVLGTVAYLLILLVSREINSVQIVALLNLRRLRASHPPVIG